MTPSREASWSAVVPGRLRNTSSVLSARAVGLSSRGTTNTLGGRSGNRKQIVRFRSYGVAMTDFFEQDLSGSRFERVHLRGATFHQVHLNDATIRDADLSGLTIRGAWMKGVRLTGVELVDAEIYGELENLKVNGVVIGPLVEAELNRRMPERAKMKPETPEGFREAWQILERHWEETVERARTLPEQALNERVDGEWSFIQTLRHLSFATDCWVNRTILGKPSPWDPLGLPWEEAPEWDAIPLDVDARPSLDEALALRAGRQAMVRELIDGLTNERLKEEVSPVGPGWPEEGMTVSVQQALRVVLNEEWEHRLYAERDLDAVEAALTNTPNGEN